MDEESHNLLLRRVDWRLLLPEPWPNRSVCATNGSLARGVEIVSGCLSPWPGTGVDLAVARDPSQRQLREAYQALCPGGHCYTEWYWPWPNGVTRVRRQLLVAGFTDVACYWPYPPRMPYQFWLPIDTPAVVERWWLRQHPMAIVAKGLSRIPRRLALALAVKATLKAGAAVPVCALARKSPQQEPGLDALVEAQEDPSDMDKLLRARWTSFGFGPTPHRLSWLLVTGGRHSSNKVVGLVSAAFDDGPRLVVKMPRVPESLAALEAEAAALTGVYASRPDGMPGVPRVLFHDKRNGFGHLCETYLEGEPLFRRLNEGNYRDFALKATDWLVALAGRPERRASKLWLNREVERRLAMFECAVGQVIEGNTLQKTRGALGAMEDLLIVPEHRDFSPWNVHVTPDGSLAILDWESAELQGLPALDLIYFLTYLAQL